MHVREMIREKTELGKLAYNEELCVLAGLRS